MKTQRLGYASHDGVSRIHALLWQPDKRTAVPRGIVQIVHGMAEHIDRYEPFARYLVSQGFVVCANDHVGHGKSVKDESDLGHIPLDAGADALIEDVHELRRLTASRYAGTVSYVLFGHSMGSFIARLHDASWRRGRGGHPVRNGPAAPPAFIRGSRPFAADRGEQRRAVSQPEA